MFFVDTQVYSIYSTFTYPMAIKGFDCMLKQYAPFLPMVIEITLQQPKLLTFYSVEQDKMTSKIYFGEREEPRILLTWNYSDKLNVKQESFIY